MSQKDVVVEHIGQYGSITPLEALTRYGIMRLAAVVHSLKEEGFSINTTLKKHDGRKYASYSFGRSQPTTTNQLSLEI